ncbi:MAG: tRNA (N6-isopentenyl adenosine(37)-C2)-methylthiotransferase MiaB [Chloroflexota bacterium]|nr:tRNA (N6-isopentenyl adenosine(37)-C2)-methylthiotransferase MiaB [Chloroflexota bacterium]
MPTFYIWTIGCQMNKADSRMASEELARLGYHPVERAWDADLVILNTCVVRQSAEDRTIGYLSSLKPLKQQNSDARLVVMGCLVGDDNIAQLRRRFPYVDAWLKPSDIEGLIDFAQADEGETSEISRTLRPQRAPVSAFVPVMHGCDHHCTFCIVRLRRGRERSYPISKVVCEVKSLASRGAREVTLLGQNVDSYGHDLPGEPTLADLLRAVHEVEGLQRIRFLSSHPGDFRPEIIEAVAELDKVCEHFELPVQSGDDEVLHRMGRGYTVAQYRALIERVRARVPNSSVITDVIVGFPGETVAQFENTRRLLEEIRFDMVHIAAYSERPGTPAARLDDDVPPEEKERRRKVLEALQERIVGEINQKLLGRTIEVLVERKHKGRWRGRTRTHKLVFFEDNADWRGKLAQVKITWAGPWSMVGEVTASAWGPDGYPVRTTRSQKRS